MPESTGTTEPNPQELHRAVEDIRNQYIKFNTDNLSDMEKSDPVGLSREWTHIASDNPAFSRIIHDLKTRLFVTLDVKRDPTAQKTISSSVDDPALLAFLNDILLTRAIAFESSERNQELKPMEEEVKELIGELDGYIAQNNKPRNLDTAIEALLTGALRYRPATK